MPHITGKFRLCWPGIMLSFLIMITSAQASNTFFEFDLPSQPLTQSLEQFQKTTGINIVYAPKELANYYSPAIQGQYTPRQAIQILLAEHRLNAEFISDSMIAVKSASAVQ
ncbi:STN domain-containing protein, partial [Nitrosomonas europaea]|uniref:STN domain-containing protein n=1 Tax=Nitrosomonas europaea TaxID=915 RepID=UPI002BEE9A13